MNGIMKYWWLFTIGVLFFGIGCDNEDDITVSEGLEVSYTLPQGDHPYDTDIVEWFEKYGFYTLYQYEKKDIYWANESWEERFEDMEGGPLRAKCADPEYVGQQLELFEYSFLDIYPEDLLSFGMPLKVLLCSELWNTERLKMYDWEKGEYVTTLVFHKLWAYEGWDYIALNGGSAEMDTIGAGSKMELQATVNGIFLQRLNKKEVFEITEEFVSVSDYSGYIGTESEAFARGFIRENPVSEDIEGSKKADFNDYLMLVGIPMKQLENVPGLVNDYDYEVSLIGALHPSRDVNQLVRQKYNIMIKILKQHGIDTDKLQYPDFE